jgi:hypothetical protein
MRKWNTSRDFQWRERAERLTIDSDTRRRKKMPINVQPGSKSSSLPFRAGVSEIGKGKTQKATNKGN